MLAAVVPLWHHSGAPSPLSRPTGAKNATRPLSTTILRKMAEIDTETLITAVKKRPALYNKHDLNYFSHKKHKAKLWTDVCKEVFADWDEFKPQNKVEYGHELQRRWKSLRTCFSRELGIQKKEKMQMEQHEGPRKKRKRYEYFNMMSFLLEPGEENDLTADTEDDSSDPLDTVKSEPIAYETTDVGNSSRCDLETEVGLLRPMYERNENLEDKILDMLKDIKKDEEDEDRQFMLSLVPSFRKLKDKQKFEARIEILRVLKEITFREESK